MNFLLDTHTFIWLSYMPHKLNPQTLALLKNPANTRFLSIVSVWEIQIKASIGKLFLPLPVKDFVLTQRILGAVASLPLIEDHIWGLANLPLYHRDPFDRLLIAQAIAENLVVVTVDPIFAQYPIQCLI